MTDVLPLTEFDDDPVDVITSAVDHSLLSLPPRGVLTLLGATTPTWAADHGFTTVAQIPTITMDFPVWVGQHRGVDVALLEVPLGAPAATIVADHVFRHGIRAAVAVGSCGGLVHFDEGEFVVPTRALRDEGTSFHYRPPSRWIELDEDMVHACTSAIDDAGFAHATASTWTTDAFFRETRSKIDARQQEGCTVVDMECSALAACARFRGARYGQILFTADTLASEVHDVRDWGRASHSTALRLALDAVTRAPLPS
ncbi:nucleoside phosphorylase [Austwickia sp. TVS 96-490-7B]|uniref:nucleoside phosphorylase n=1 Tax=Austwickia sp. TVS 96-490-7B TaxID=2830843 RepID=UPI001C58BD7C|nr:nucleoside phosphorylase [Austwickia sp. TVS 96-490-7B]